MHIIEPCCSHRQMADLRMALRGGGRDRIRGYGDMSLTEMLPALLTGYNETEMLIAAPSLPDQAADIIETWMRWQWMKVDGSGKIHVLTRLTIVADLSEELSPKASQWLKENPWGDRLVLIDKAVEPDQQALLLPDIAFTGPLNMRYGHDFVCDVTTVKEEIAALWGRFSAMAVKEDPSVAPEETEEPEAARPARTKKRGRQDA